MSITRKILDKLHLKQWGIGFIKMDVAELIRSRNSSPDIEWIPLPDSSVSKADPFLYKAADGRIHLLFERMTSWKMDGNISLIVYDADMRVVEEKVVLDTGTHLSYPFIFQEGGISYVFPENALGGGLKAYQYDESQKSIHSPVLVLDKAVLDSTILKHQGKYWLFCTHLEAGLNSELHIYFSDKLLGPYQAHVANPVVTGLKGARPAGNFIFVDGQLFRPAQNCTSYYGESVVIQKVKILNEKEYAEEFYMELKPQAGSGYSYGLHTLNYIDNLLVVDGQKSHFQPFQQLIRKIRNFF